MIIKVKDSNGNFTSMPLYQIPSTLDGVNGTNINRYSECSTASATSAKAVTITSGTISSLTPGVRVTVDFANPNTADNPTLNVNNTGAKAIYLQGELITTGSNKGLLKGIVDFVYNGTVWNLVTGGLDISGKADLADLSTVATTGSYNDLSNKPTIPSLSGYATESYVDDKLEDILGIDASGVDALKTALSDSDTTTGLLTAIAGKVDKDGNKVLSTNDYTTTEKNKLAGIESGAEVHKAPTSSEITTALGYTPYNSTNPNGYTTNTGTVTGVTVGSTNYTPTDGVVTIPAYPTTLPANGGNSSTVNNHTVNSDVPANAVFTDTTYSVMGASGNSHASGLVPDPGATAGTTKYLREDGTWAEPEGGGTITATTTGGSGTAVDFDVNADTVHTTVQTLSSALKIRARKNIEALGVEDGVVIVTMNSEPIGSTLTYTDSTGITRNFKIGDLVKYYDSSNTIYYIYTLCNIANNTATWIKTDFVSYEIQTLTTAQKTLVQKNIGVVDSNGVMIAPRNTSYTTAQVRNIVFSTSEPTSSDGSNGDIWIVYEV